MKKWSICFLLLIASVPLFAQAMPEQAAAPPAIVASTSWTAAFADIGGLDDVPFIAPANLIHPPEYEIIVSDVLKINNAQYFIYAGYERMMQSMGSSIKKNEASLVKINTNNSIENVREQAQLIASLTGTQAESDKRVEQYVQVVEKGAEKVRQQGMDRLKVYCHSMQVYLAKDLGLFVAGTFGPGPLTADQIAEVAKGGYNLIIDNVHNPIAKPLLEGSPGSRLVVWRNFPERGGRGSLAEMVGANIEELFR
jgi:hypothetical protein